MHGVRYLQTNKLSAIQFNSNIKQLVSAAMFLIVAIPLCSIVLFEFQKHELFRQLEHRFSNKQLIQLSIPVNQLSWVKENKELIIEGQMFDVKQMVIKQGMATITGFFDKEEDQVNELLSKSLSHQKESEQGNAIWKMIHLFTGWPVIYQLCFNSMPDMENNYCFTNYNISSRPIAVLIPPPLANVPYSYNGLSNY
jgi:hypothetical protein